MSEHGRSEFDEAIEPEKTIDLNKAGKREMEPHADTTESDQAEKTVEIGQSVMAGFSARARREAATGAEADGGATADGAASPGASADDEGRAGDNIEADDRPSGRRRRASFAGAMIGVLLLILGFTLATQVRSNDQDAQLANARPEDLVRILSDLDARSERLRRELADLEDAKRKLDSGAQGREAALAEARRRAEALGVLAGNVPAEGPGLEVTFARRDDRIKADSILDAVEELRGAGAEAMQITGGNGAIIRIVASTYFVDSGEDISVDGTQMSGPYVILVIGDPQTMQTALNIPGGVVDAVHQRGGNVTMRQPDLVRVTALHSGGPLRYARPAS